MTHDLDLYEPRSEDNRPSSVYDEDSTLCAACDGVIDDDDFEAAELTAGEWKHSHCVPEEVS